MNISLILGLVAVWILMLLGVGISNIGAFVDIPSIQIVVLGTIAAVFIAFPMEKILQLPSVLKIAFSSDKLDPVESIRLLVEFAEQARREGILALENRAQQVSDEFLKKGLQLAVDGTEPDLIRDILQTEISYVQKRHQAGVEILEFMATLAPGLGMIGTLIGLILMLGSMSDVASIGPNMAVALITTMYGSIVANTFCLPVANLLVQKSSHEVLVKNMMLEGIMSLQSGDNPRVVEEKLSVFIDPSRRVAVKSKAGGE